MGFIQGLADNLEESKKVVEAEYSVVLTSSQAAKNHIEQMKLKKGSIGRNAGGNSEAMANGYEDGKAFEKQVK